MADINLVIPRSTYLMLEFLLSDLEKWVAKDARFSRPNAEIRNMLIKVASARVALRKVNENKNNFIISEKETEKENV